VSVINAAASARAENGYGGARKADSSTDFADIGIDFLEKKGGRIDGSPLLP